MHLINKFLKNLVKTAYKSNFRYYINCKSEIFPFFKIREEEKKIMKHFANITWYKSFKKLSNNYLVKPRRFINIVLQESNFWIFFLVKSKVVKIQ